MHQTTNTLWSKLMKTHACLRQAEMKLDLQRMSPNQQYPKCRTKQHNTIYQANCETSIISLTDTDSLSTDDSAKENKPHFCACPLTHHCPCPFLIKFDDPAFALSTPVLKDLPALSGSDTELPPVSTAFST